MQTLDTENWRFRDEDPRLSMNQERDPNRRIPQWERAGLRHGHEVYRASLQDQGQGQAQAQDRAQARNPIRDIEDLPPLPPSTERPPTRNESIRSNIEQMPRNVGNGTVHSRGRVGAGPAQRRRVMEQDQEQNAS